MWKKKDYYTDSRDRSEIDLEKTRSETSAVWPEPESSKTSHKVVMLGTTAADTH